MVGISQWRSVGFACAVACGATIVTFCVVAYRRSAQRPQVGIAASPSPAETTPAQSGADWVRDGVPIADRTNGAQAPEPLDSLSLFDYEPCVVTGVVLDCRGVAGVPGAKVRACRDGGTELVAASGTAGMFAVDITNLCRAETGAVVWLRAGNGMQALFGQCRHVHGLKDARPFSFKLCESSEEAVGSRLLDCETGQPVPKFVLMKTNSAGEELGMIETGLFGEIPHEESILAPEMLVPIDSTELRSFYSNVSLRPHGAGGYCVAIGPTYFLNLSGLPERSNPAGFQWLARLRPIGKFGADGVRASSWIPLREGAPRWVRFPSGGQYEPGSRENWLLEVRTSDAEWFGALLVPQVRGIHSGVLDVRCEPGIQLRGRVLCRGEGHGGAFVRVWPETRKFDEVDDSEVIESDSNGRFIVYGAQVGRYNLECTSECGYANAGVVPRTGDAQHLELRLEARKAIGGLCVTLSADPGLSRSGCTVRLRDADSLQVVQRKRVGESDWRGDGTVAVCFEELSEVEYLLDVTSECWKRWSPDQLLVRPGEVGYWVSLDRSATDRSVVFKPRSASDGSIIEEFTLGIRSESGAWRHSRARSGAVALEGLSEGGSVDWVVSPDGYEAVGGSFVAPRPAQAVDAYEIDVACRPGWGGRMELVDVDGNALVGLCLELDGKEVGVSDVDGIVRAYSPTRPRRFRVTVERGKRRLLGGSVDVATGILLETEGKVARLVVE